MKKRSPWLTNIAGLASSAGIRAWMRMLDYQIAYYETSVDPADPHGQRSLYVFWHENLLMPLYLRGRCNLAMLISRHRDADVLSRLAFHFGFQFMRGSTARGGVACLRELLRRWRILPPDNHARRPARAAPQDGSRSDLPGCEDRNAAGAARARLRSPLASARRGIALPFPGHSRGPAVSPVRGFGCRSSSTARGSNTIASAWSGCWSGFHWKPRPGPSQAPPSSAKCRSVRVLFRWIQRFQTWRPGGAAKRPPNRHPRRCCNGPREDVRW